MSAIVTISVTQTGQIALNCSTISLVFSSLLAMIISGCKAFILSNLMVFVPPIISLVDFGFLSKETNQLIRSKINLSPLSDNSEDTDEEIQDELNELADENNLRTDID